ncbi:MAG: NADH-quinone oxidoreductase subunit J [Verrucomicrobiota bacterium]
MLDLLFYIFAAVTVACGAAMVLSRNPVNAAMFMILALVGMSATFVLLEAFFLAALQVLVYAGAVMVLFLFIIMLLDVEAGEKISFKSVTSIMSVVALAALVGFVIYLFNPGAAPEGARALSDFTPPALPPEDAPHLFTTSAKSLGYLLFTKYLLPLQVTGFLLLVAMVGVILLSKKMTARGTAEAETEAPAPKP